MQIVGALGWNIDCYYASSVIANQKRDYDSDVEVTRSIPFESLLIDKSEEEKVKKRE